MVILVRVDDRLLHGQIICSWVPYLKVESLIVASDEAAGDELVKEIIGSCAHSGLSVEVISVHDAVRDVNEGRFDAKKAILIVGNLKDAMRAYEQGVRFETLNIGNIHHDDDGRMITPSVIVDHEDETIIERLEALGVSMDFRAVPTSSQVSYNSREKNGT